MAATGQTHTNLGEQVTGQGTMATQNASAVAITGGTIGGFTLNNSGIGFSFTGNTTVGYDTSNGTVDSAFRMAAGQRFVLEATGVVSLSWTNNAIRFRYNTNDLTTTDSSGNFTATGSISTKLSPSAGDNSSFVPTTSFLASTTLRGDLSQSWSAAYQKQAQSNLGIVTGTTVVDFGTAGSMSASVTITGQANIVAGSAVDAWIVATASADHSADEHAVETINVLAGAIVAGTGFTIFALSQTVALYGKWTVSWSWQ